MFDPLLEWLGIPPHERPICHYRLLGLRPFETDVEQIRAAAEAGHLERDRHGNQCRQRHQSFEQQTEIHDGGPSGSSSLTTGRLARRFSHMTPRRSAMPTHSRSRVPYLDAPRSRGR